MKLQLLSLVELVAFTGLVVAEEPLFSPPTSIRYATMVTVEASRGPAGDPLVIIPPRSFQHAPSITGSALSTFATTCLLEVDDPSAVLSLVFPKPPKITGSALTALATAIQSIQSTFYNSPKFTSVRQAVYEAAPEKVQSVLATKCDWPYQELFTEAWATGIPDSAEAAIWAHASALNAAKEEFSGSAARPNRALAAAVGGVILIVGVMVAL